MCRTRGVPLHCDAVQALGQIDLDVAGIPSVALSAHKVGGPVGVGALVLDRDQPVAPLVHGGGQERDVRSGTWMPPASRGSPLLWLPTPRRPHRRCATS